MQQMIDKKSVYVVDFDTMPEMPITWLTEGEKAYALFTGKTGNSHGSTYAQALTDAIETGIITEPGKYGIYLVPGTPRYEVYRINE